MFKVQKLATERDYVFIGGKYQLGAGFLALPGAIAEDPKSGSAQYNEYLVEKYLAGRPITRERVQRCFNRYWKNRRVQSVLGLIESGEFEGLGRLGVFEYYLFFLHYV